LSQPGQVTNGMGADHRVRWWHACEKGRAVVAALGHNQAIYRDARYLDHLWGGIWWAANGR
jgi:type 1 glutamine amidotransferase